MSKIKSKKLIKQEDDIVDYLNRQSRSQKELEPMLDEIRRMKGDDKAIEQYINNFVIGRNSQDPYNKAEFTNRLLHELIGAAAVQEVPGLDSKIPKNLEKANLNLQKVANTVYKNRQPLEDALNLGNKLTFGDFEERKAFGIHMPKHGIYINDAFRKANDANAGLYGTLIHELSHRGDALSKMMALLKLKQTKGDDWINSNLNNSVYIKNFNELLGNSDKSNLSELIQKFKESNPGKLDETSDILSHGNIEVPNNYEELQKNVSKDKQNLYKLTPIELQDAYSGRGHWFNRNFPLDAIKKIAREGVGGIKTIAPFLAKGAVGAAAGGLPLLAEAAEQAFDTESSGANPNMPHYWLEKGIKNPEEQKQRAKVFTARQKLDEALQPRYSGLSNFEPDYMNQNLEEAEKANKKLNYEKAVLEAQKAGTLRPNYVETSNEDNTDMIIKSKLDALRKFGKR